MGRKDRKVVYLMDLDGEAADFAKTLMTVTRTDVSFSEGIELFRHFGGNIMRAYDEYTALRKKIPRGCGRVGPRMLERVEDLYKHKPIAADVV